jgi:hypothetical protein
VHDFAKHLVIDLPEFFCLNPLGEVYLLVFQPCCLTPLGLVKVALQKILWDNYSSIKFKKVYMKVTITQDKSFSTDAIYDDEAKSLPPEELASFIEDAIRHLHTHLLTLQSIQES